MATIEIQLDEHILMQARKFAEKHQYNLEEFLVRIIEQLGTARPDDALMGLFSDEPELLDQVVDSAMLLRETATLRSNSE
jgi:hypothetical protein